MSKLKKETNEIDIYMNHYIDSIDDDEGTLI